MIDLGISDDFAPLAPEGRVDTGSGGSSPSLAPLPKRVAEDSDGAEATIADPLGFTEDLVARATQLLKTLDHDVSGLEAEQDDERKRIEKDWQHQQEAVDLAKNRLARMHSHARQIAAHKARLAEFEVAANPIVPPRPPEVVTVDSFMELMGRIDVELRAAQGITGAIRLPKIALLLNEAGASDAAPGRVGRPDPTAAPRTYRGRAEHRGQGGAGQLRDRDRDPRARPRAARPVAPSHRPVVDVVAVDHVGATRGAGRLGAPGCR